MLQTDLKTFDLNLFEVFYICMGDKNIVSKQVSIFSNKKSINIDIFG